MNLYNYIMEGMEGLLPNQKNIPPWCEFEKYSEKEEVISLLVGAVIAVCFWGIFLLVVTGRVFHV